MQERIMVADVAQVYRLWNEYAAAATEGDIERWISLWIDDGIQMLPCAPSRIGKAQIRMGMQRLLDLFHSGKMVIQLEEVRILGDRAYSHGTYEFEIALRQGGGSSICSGKFLGILEKQEDGSWKIAIDCHNHSSPSEWLGGTGSRRGRLSSALVSVHERGWSHANIDARLLGGLREAWCVWFQLD